MLNLPGWMITIVTNFAPAIYAESTWYKVEVLVAGAILATGRRTVSAVLRVMGLSQAGNYAQYHHVLNRARWSGLDVSGIQAAMTLEGSVDELAFEAFIQQVLLPTLRPGQIVIMDNLSSHKTDKVEQLITGASCQLIFLPAYSPDLSPIEEAFSKLKAFLRRARAQSMPDLIHAIQQGLETISSPDARGWFSHAGFSVQAT